MAGKDPSAPKEPKRCLEAEEGAGIAGGLGAGLGAAALVGAAGGPLGVAVVVGATLLGFVAGALGAHGTASACEPVGGDGAGSEASRIVPTAPLALVIALLGLSSRMKDGDTADGVATTGALAGGIALGLVALREGRIVPHCT